MPEWIHLGGFLSQDFGNGRLEVRIPDTRYRMRQGGWVYPLIRIKIAGEDVWVMLTGHKYNDYWEAETVARLLTMARRYPLTWNDWLRLYAELPGLARELGHPELAEPIDLHEWLQEEV